MHAARWLLVALAFAGGLASSCGVQPAATPESPGAPASRSERPQQPTQAPLHHLYVAYSKHEFAGVARFTYADGGFGPKPDLTYPDQFEPLAVDAQGSLYASSYPYAHSETTISVFPLGSRAASRTLTLPHIIGGSTYATALAVDSQNYLYVAYTAFAPFLQGHQKPPTRPAATGLPPVGIMVFQPNASGKPTPILGFSMRDDCCGADGLALDASGNLYASVDDLSNHGHIVTVASPRTTPHVLRSFTSPALRFPTGIVSDASLLHVLAYGPNASAIATFPVTAEGAVKPVREIGLPNQAAFFGLAERGSELYVEWSTDDAIAAYPATATGTPAPSATLLLDLGADDVKVGL